MTSLAEMKIGIFVAALFLLNPFSDAKESLRADHVQVSLLLPQKFGEQADRIGLRFQLEPHWHIYWENPGDSGAAPKFEWTDDGLQIGEVLWPKPKRIPVAHLTNIGYENEVVFPIPVRVLNGQKEVGGKVELEWLVCKEECIPGFGTLEFKRPTHQAEAVWKKSDRELLNRSLKQITLEEEVPPLALKTSRSENGLFELSIRNSGAKISSLELFPRQGEWISPKQPIEKEKDLSEQSWIYQFEYNSQTSLPDQHSFLIVIDGKPYSLSLPEPKAIADIPIKPEGESDWVLLIFAFLGGVILNCMPCVLPVLSIKFLSLLKAPSEQRIREGFFYLCGVLVTFTILGAGFLLLRSTGSTIGWGYQLQSPVIVFGLILLFWLMALNFLGFFEFGDSLVNQAGKIRGGGSFVTGILAVFVAAPCTGPFMGSALGAAATLPAFGALMIFVMLGLGLGLPFFVVAFFPSLYQKIPKPGPWMNRLKEFLAFPLLGTVIWLLWVLGLQLGSDAWFYVSLALCILVFCIWLAKGVRPLTKAFAWIIALWIILFVGQKIQSIDQASTSKMISQTAWQNFDPKKIQELRKQGESVFIDYTAAWCITCQVNKKTTLDTIEGLETFKTKGIHLFRADWTKQDPVITEELDKLERSSVPTYVFYPKNQAPLQILPQILSIQMIKDLK